MLGLITRAEHCAPYPLSGWRHLWTAPILPVENNDITAFKAGGCSKATCKPLNPPHDFPYIPTDPLLQGWEEIQARKYAKKDYPFTK